MMGFIMALIIDVIILPLQRILLMHVWIIAIAINMVQCVAIIGAGIKKKLHFLFSGTKSRNNAI
jgi:hypothetical protein